jgi:hypothetical protein
VTTTPQRVVLVPGVLALLPEYAGLVDPVTELRAACVDAVAWLGEAGEDIEIRAGGQGTRVAEALLDLTGVSRQLPGRPPRPAGGLIVVGNGSAKRTEKAPGFLDERAAAFDAELGRALREGDTGALGTLDETLATELWADVESLVCLGREGLPPGCRATVDYDDDPFGVQYWVMRWTCGS